MRGRGRSRESGMRRRGKAPTPSFLPGLPESEAKLEPERSHLLLEFIDRTATVKNIVGTRTVGTGTSRCRAVRAAMTMKATLGTTGMRSAMLVRMTKTPALLALAREGDERPDRPHGATNIDTAREVMAFKKDLGDVHRTGPATTGRDGIAMGLDSLVLGQQR